MSSQQVVIAGDGVNNAGRAFQTMSKYLEQTRKRSELLSRIQVSPMVRLMDLATGPLSQIFSSITEYAQKQWGISVRVVPATVEGSFATAGSTAGGVFLNAFLAAFDASKIADKAKTSMNGITVNVNVTGGGSGGNGGAGGGGWGFIKDVASGALGGALGEGITKGMKKVPLPKKFSEIGKFIKNPFKRSSKGNPAAESPTKEIASNSASNPAKGDDLGKKAAEIGKDKTEAGAGGPKPNGKKGFFGKAKDWLKENWRKAGKPDPKLTANAASKADLPLALATSVVSVATAKPGKNQNRAFGQGVGMIVGGAVGAAFGGPAGAFLLGTAGSIAGGEIADLISNNASKLKKLWPFGKKKNKKKKAPEAMPEPSDPPSDSRSMNANSNASPIYSQTNMGIAGGRGSGALAPTSINIMPGAVNLNIEQSHKLDYMELQELIGTGIVTQIQQKFENRA